MKVREGHVSNSSSSSFYLIVTKDLCKEVLAKAKPLTKELVGLMEPRKATFLDKEVLIYSFSESYGEGGVADMDVPSLPTLEYPGNGTDKDVERYEKANDKRSAKLEKAWDDFVAAFKGQSISWWEQS